MFTPVTEETGPKELANDSRKWTQIGERYYQSDTVDGICLEINNIHKQFRWFLYDEKAAIPDMAITFDDQLTLAEALADAYDYLKGYKS